MTATVLLVEDERKLRELVRSYLERAGLAVLSTSSGAEAITLAASAAPDLVVLDLGLPDVPGETVARELRTGLICSSAIVGGMFWIFSAFGALNFSRNWRAYVESEAM